MANRWGKNGKSERLYFLKSLQMVTAAMKLKDAAWKKAMTNLDSTLKSKDRGITRWQRSRWMWSTSLSMDTSGIHLQTQKCMQNTS